MMVDEGGFGLGRGNLARANLLPARREHQDGSPLSLE